MGTIFAVVILTARRGLIGEIFHALRARHPLPIDDAPTPTADDAVLVP
jgi:hypothetical protein